MLAEKTMPRLLHVQRQLHTNGSLGTLFFREENASLTQNFHQLEEKFKEKVGYFSLCRYLCIAKVIELCQCAEPKRTANVVVMNYLRTTVSTAHLDDSKARFKGCANFQVSILLRLVAQCYLLAKHFMLFVELSLTSLVQVVLIRQIAERGDIFDLLRKWLTCSERKVSSTGVCISADPLG